MANVIFLRHGQAENNTKRILAGRTPGVPLTDTGRTQALEAARLVAHLHPAAIYSSPIQRARDTAQIVADYINDGGGDGDDAGGGGGGGGGGNAKLNVSTDERLVELEMGDFTGMRYDDIFANRGNVFLEYYGGSREISRMGVETFEEVRSRVAGIVKHVTQEHPGQNVVLVTHMDPIKAMLASVVDLSADALFELIIANASLNIFRGHDDAGAFSVSAINMMHPSRFDQNW